MNYHDEVILMCTHKGIRKKKILFLQNKQFIWSCVIVLFVRCVNVFKIC